MSESGAQSAQREVAQSASSGPQQATYDGGVSTGDLIGRASEQLSDLVRSEMQLARAELKETVKHAGVGAGLFGAAGIVALYGGGVLIACAILALALVLDAWLAALIVAVVLFVVAGIAALVGKKQVEQAAPPLQHSVESMKQDVQTVKERAGNE